MACVLIVDDNEMDRLLFESILETAGHEIHLAANGDEARVLYAKLSVDVVVTDLHMHPGHGLELIQALTASDPDAAIIAVSGTGPAQLDMARSLGARLALPKPMDAKMLLEAVEEVVST